MFTSRTARRTPITAVVLVLVLGVGSLSACRSGQTTPGTADRPSSVITKIERGDLRGLSADRIETMLQREGERNRELSARFGGVPADRIDEQLAREAQR